MPSVDPHSPPVVERTLLDVLLRQAAMHSTRTAFRFVSDDGRSQDSLTYSQLLDRARRIGGAMQRHAVAGARAVLLFPPGLEFIAAFFGCQCAGVIAVPTSASHPKRLERDWPRLRSILLDCGAKIIVTSAEFRGPLAEFCSGESDLAAITLLAADDIEERGANWQMPAAAGDDLALLQYTSGSTGTPRGVMISHANLLCNLKLIQEAFETNEETIGVFWLPFHHDMGLIGGILETWYCGGESTFFSPLSFIHRPQRWLQMISDRRANVSGGPNFAFEECVNRISPEARRSLDLRSWELAFCGAEPIHLQTLDRFAEAFAEAGFQRSAFYPCYGLAEATLLVTGGIRGRPLVVDETSGTAGSHRVSCGFARPGQRVWIVSPEARLACAEGEVGEIWVSGGSVGKGYWGRRDESQETFQAFTADGQGPFLRTGDLGYLQQNELFVTGRLKDLIIIAGRNHYPQDLERTAQESHPGLRKNACVAFSIEKDRQEQLVVVAEVEPRAWRREQSQEAASAVIRAVRQAIADSHEVTPSTVLLVAAGAIPRTTSGKVRRRECREEFLAGRLENLGEASSERC